MYTFLLWEIECILRSFCKNVAFSSFSVTHRTKKINFSYSTGISGEKVEIDPVASKSGTRLFRQKAFTHDADSIASCDILEEKDGGTLVKFIFISVCAIYFIT